MLIFFTILTLFAVIMITNIYGVLTIMLNAALIEVYTVIISQVMKRGLQSLGSLLKVMKL